MLLNIWAHLSYFLKDFWFYLILLSFSLIAFVVTTYKIYKSQTSLKRKKITISLTFSLFLLIVVTSLFEAYFRFVYDESDGLGFLKVNQRWHSRHVVFNNYFFRDRDFDTNKKEGITRIGVIGDSIAFGGGIKNVNNRFSNLLEKKLQENGYQVEVYNLGKSGYDTQTQIKEFEKIKNLNFDIIVWEYFLNDIQPEERSTGTSIISKNSQRAKIIEFISRHSFFLDFLYWRFSSTYQSTIVALRTADLAQYKNQQILEMHKYDIETFIQNLKKDNKKVVVIIFPFINALGSNYPAEDVHKLISEHFEKNQVEVIDLLQFLKDKDPKLLIASRFDAHPNETVHALAADKLFEKVKTLLEK